MGTNRMLMGKIMLGAGIIIAIVVTVLGYNTYTSSNVKASVSDSRKMIQMREFVNDLVIWSTDYALTWKAESRTESPSPPTAPRRPWTPCASPTKNDAATLGRIVELEKLFNDFQTKGAEMAEAYIKYDRVVGNSYIDNYHLAGENLQKSAAELIEISTRRRTRRWTEAS